MSSPTSHPSRRPLGAAAVIGLLALTACGLVARDPVVAPVFDAVEPPPPSSNRRPILAGSAERGTIVVVYASSGCTGAPVGQGWASANSGRFSLPASAAPNATTVFHATATDAEGKVSACAPGPIYLHDDQAPAAPALAGFSPAPPSSNPSPLLAGTAEPGSHLAVFAAAGCAGPAVASMTVPESGGFEVTVPATPGAETAYSAQATDAAGNASRCSSSHGYVHDGSPPDTPVLAGFTPPSGGSVSTSVLGGSAEPGALITIHGDAACSGAPVGTTVAGPSGAFEWVMALQGVRPVSYWARATDQAGNASACSESAATYLVTSASLAFAAPGCLASGSALGGATIDLTRASTAEFLSGVAELRCAPDQLRIGPAGLIVEEGRTNAAARSDRLEDPVWELRGQRCAVWPDALPAPDGAVAMDVLDAAGGAAGDARCQEAPTVSAGEFAASAWAAAVAGTSGATVRAHCPGGGAAAACTCDRSDGEPCQATLLADGCAASGEVGTAPVRLTAGLRCATPSTSAVVCLEPGTAATGPGQAGFWGAQLEAGSRFSTGYIPTEAAGEARAPEVASVAELPIELLASGTAELAPDGEALDLGAVLASGTPGEGMELRFAAGRPRLSWSLQQLEHDAHAAPGRRARTTVGWAVGGDQACLYWDGIERCGALAGSAVAGAQTFLGAAAGGVAPLLNGAVSTLQLGARPTVGFNPSALLVLGDSLSAPVSAFCARPWPATVADTLGPPWMVTNMSVNAAVTSHYVIRWRTSYAHNGHGAVAILGGTNDIVQADTADQIFARLRLLYDEARAAGKRVVPITIPPCSKFAAYLDKWRALNGLIRGYCLEQGIPCADVEPIMNNGADGLAARYDSGDHKHFNQAGCDLVAATVVDLLR